MNRLLKNYMIIIKIRIIKKIKRKEFLNHSMMMIMMKMMKMMKISLFQVLENLKLIMENILILIVIKSIVYYVFQILIILNYQNNIFFIMFRLVK